MSTKINKISKSVTGTFALHDDLSITTRSGSIDITVIPHPASSATNPPAELHLYTQSGSIRVTMAPFLLNPPSVIPERAFQSSIESMSGSITAALIHNHKTSLSTVSGRIDASIYPCQPNSTSQIKLHCISGSGSMTLHPYVDSPQDKLRTLDAICHSSSGRLKIRFPSTWEGSVTSGVRKDRVRHEWEGLRVLESETFFNAIKGNGIGRLVITGPTAGVELVGESVPGVPMKGDVKDEGGCALGIPYRPALPKKTDVQEGELKPNLPKEGEQTEEEDNDWTVVENEDGVQDVTRRPPPSYDDATRT